MGSFLGRQVTVYRRAWVWLLLGLLLLAPLLPGLIASSTRATLVKLDICSSNGALGTGEIAFATSVLANDDTPTSHSHQSAGGHCLWCFASSHAFGPATFPAKGVFDTLAKQALPAPYGGRPGAAAILEAAFSRGPPALA